ncbi:MAG: RluA family pseudouridine synthase [Pseudomonadota bacterium]
MNVIPQVRHEDKVMLVVDKPAGMPAASLKKGEAGTVAAWLLKQYLAQAKLPKGNLEAGLVNRLDNETSGILVAAKTLEAYENLREQFKKGSAHKEYLALVIGYPPKQGTIDISIAHHPKKKKKMVVCDSGRPASTSFSLLKKFHFKTFEYALLSITIKTGVRHQIRVHLAHIGHPIAGDKLYQNPKKRAADPLELKRHFLHSSKLTIFHPTTGKEMTFESPLPAELTEVLAKLKEA